MDALNAIGRRKSAVARVHMTNGSGEITINGRKLAEYFPTTHIQNKVRQPLELVELGAGYNYKVIVSGGGFKGQAEAISLAISRALVKLNADNKPVLKAQKLLTRDSRIVERKKFGKPKARKSFQFSKR
jgi:small subunit ribosomal protein S9